MRVFQQIERHSRMRLFTNRAAQPGATPMSTRPGLKEMLKRMNLPE
jgi:hypothetical protein